MGKPVIVDPRWTVAATAPVDPKNPVEALKAAYNNCAARVTAHGKTPAQVEVIVRVAPDPQ